MTWSGVPGWFGVGRVKDLGGLIVSYPELLGVLFCVIPDMGVRGDVTRWLREH